MWLMSRLESLAPRCIWTLFRFPAGTVQESGKCRSAERAERQESAGALQSLSGLRKGNTCRRVPTVADHSLATSVKCWAGW